MTETEMDDEATTHRAWAMGLYQRHGNLTPEIVREAARPPDSPAHGYVFNVPEDTAAESYYLERARDLIRRVRVRIVPDSGAKKRHVRFYHAVPDEKDAFVYVSIDDLVRQPDKLAAARTEAVRRVSQAQEAVLDLDAAAAGTPTSLPTKRALRALRTAHTELTTTVPPG